MDCHEILILSGVLSKWHTMVPNLFFICLANFVSTKVDLAAFILATRKYLVPSFYAFFSCLKFLKQEKKYLIVRIKTNYPTNICYVTLSYLLQASLQWYCFHKIMMAYCLIHSLSICLLYYTVGRDQDSK